MIRRDGQRLGLQEVEHDDAHLRVAAAADSSHPTEPRFVPELLSRHLLHDVEQLLDHEVFQGAERLSLEDRPDGRLLRRRALAQHQLAHAREQGRGRLRQDSLHGFATLQLRQPGQLSRRELEERLHPVVDVGALRLNEPRLVTLLRPRKGFLMKEMFVLILEIGFALLLVAGVAILLRRHSGPTRSVAHVLYDVEHPARDKS